MSSKKILIVDDSMVTRLMIKKIIAESTLNCEFFEFDSADKASQALETLDKIDFATLDQNMPGTLTGLDFAEILKKKLPKPKIVLVTANVQDAIRNRASFIGIDFIDKPITSEKLLPLLSNI